MSLNIWLITVLLISVLFIIVTIARFKIHPFISLVLAAYLTGAMAGIPVGNIAVIISTGFGNLMAQIGLIIVLGTLIGTILEKSGAAVRLADMILKVVGPKYPGLAMSLIGYVVSIPVFCDSGYVILSSLKKSLVHKTGKPSVILTVALATGLYATHTLVPPTPGPVAAAGNLGLDNQMGLVILLGMFVALFTMLAGYGWALFSGKRFRTTEDDFSEEVLSSESTQLPGGLLAILPVLVPILLISIRSVAVFPSHPLGQGFLFVVFNFCGLPLNALFAGILLSIPLLPEFDHRVLTGWVSQSLVAAAPILLITGAGGAFGAILKEAQVGDSIGKMLSDYQLGIFLPFIIAAAFKSAQGSSTVSLVATSALIAPLLASLGLDSMNGRLLAVMAIGAGSMVVSHANDSYFWVVSQFSGMDVQTAYKTMTMATLIQGIVSMAVVFVLSLFLV